MGSMLAPRFASFALACAVISTTALATIAYAPDAAAATPRTRAEYAAALATIKPGMKAAEVRARLGAPDDIKTERDPGGITAARTVAIWRWGTDAHLGFATLGAVHIQADDTVQYVFGGGAKPLVDMDEERLRQLLRVLAAVPSYNDPFDPGAIMTAVDALVMLGKARALAVIDEFLRVSSWLDDPGREGTFYVLRALFLQPPGGALPPMVVGGPTLQPPADPRKLPLFPLVFVDDLPLCLVDGWILGGEPESPEMHLKWYREHGEMRTQPLAPWIALPPMTTIDVVAKNAVTDLTRPDGYLAKIVKVDDHLRASLMAQVERFVHPARPRQTWQRVWWDMPFAGTTKARVTLERQSKDEVMVEVRFELMPGASVPASTLTLGDHTQGAAGAAQSIAIGATSAPANSTSGMVTGTRLKLPEGHTLILTLSRGSTISAGPLLVP